MLFWVGWEANVGASPFREILNPPKLGLTMREEDQKYYILTFGTWTPPESRAWLAFSNIKLFTK